MIDENSPPASPAIVLDKPKMIAAAMDSVNLLLAGKPPAMSEDEWAACKRRNADHLEIVAAKVTLSNPEKATFDAALATAA